MKYCLNKKKKKEKEILSVQHLAGSPTCITGAQTAAISQAVAISIATLCDVSAAPFHRWGNWCSERLSTFLKVTQEEDGGWDSRTLNLSTLIFQMGVKIGLPLRTPVKIKRVNLYPERGTCFTLSISKLFTISILNDSIITCNRLTLSNS